MKTHTLQIYYTFQKVNSKVADQTGRMRRLIFAIRMKHSQVFLCRLHVFPSLWAFQSRWGVGMKNGGLSHMRACSV